MKFSDLKLNNWLVRQCESFGLKEPTPVQSNCIPQILTGQDCIGCAKTGSGKTLAFALPILQKLCEDPYGIFAVVLTPTRELAIQIADQFLAIGKPINLRLSLIIGGMSMIDQGNQLSKRPHVVVATPGRLGDHLLSCKTFTFSRVKFFVIDEADQMLCGDYDDEIKLLLESLPSNRQTLMFSATLTDSIEQVMKLVSDKAHVYVDPSPTATVEKLKQFYVLCPSYAKEGYLVHILNKFREENKSGSIIIFTNSCEECQVMSDTLSKVGLTSIALSSMMKQKKRLQNLAKFRSSHIKILIATDIASRGLDIPTVELVINYSLPSEPKIYVHRVGRTARAGRLGTAISIVTPKDVPLVHAIEDLTKVILHEHLVDEKEVLKILMNVKMTMKRTALKLEENEYFQKREIHKKLKVFRKLDEIANGKNVEWDETAGKGKKRKVKEGMKSKKMKKRKVV